MPAPQHRSKEALRTRREGPVRFGSAILRSRISAGRLLMVVWESAVGVGFGACRCDTHMAISMHSVGVLLQLCYLSYDGRKAWRCWNLDDTIDCSTKLSSAAYYLSRRYGHESLVMRDEEVWSRAFVLALRTRIRPRPPRWHLLRQNVQRAIHREHGSLE
jgi:hypothetical protein